jgi:PAS domain S-box-containing protein
MIDRHLRTILDNAPDGVLIEGRDDQVCYVNPAYARLLGYPSTTELMGVTIRQIAHPEDYERLSWFGRCRASGKPAPTRYPFRAMARGGSIKSFDASISLTRIDATLFITTIVREIVAAPAKGTNALALPGTKLLSDRELEVIQLVLDGRRSKEIAALLNVSEKTVWTHRSRAYQKLAIQGDRELFLRASELGLL